MQGLSDIRGRRMGIVYVTGKVTGPTGSLKVKFLVDSGASYTLLPEVVWKKIGLKPKKKMSFSMADGTEMVRPLSECHIEILDDETHTRVVLGEEGDTALLGAITLEELALVLNPFSRELKPMKLMMA
jgi:clan AA aspartic protease